MTMPSQMENPVLFRGSWSLWQSPSLFAAAIASIPLVSLWWPLGVIVVPLFCWASVRYTPLVAEVTRDGLLIQTPQLTRYVPIEDIRHVGRWYGTVWVRGSLNPWHFPWGRDRAALFDVLDSLRGSSTGTP